MDQWILLMLLAIILPLISVSFLYVSTKMLSVLCFFLDENHENDNADKINNYTTPINFFIGLGISVAFGLASTFICSFNPDR